MVATTAVLLCTLSSAAYVSAAPASAAPSKPGDKPAVRSVPGVKPVEPKFVAPPDDAKAKHRITRTTWPEAAEVTLDPRGTTAVRNASAPVWVAPAKGAGATSIKVKVLGRTAAEKAAVDGLLIAVTPDRDATGAARVGIDYADFAQAGGGNYGSRLQLSRMPACILTTPEAAGCRTRQPLVSRNDSAAQSVSAEVPLAGAAAAPIVLAALAGPAVEGGNGGTYAASELKPSGSWSAGNSSGSFTYSYPITMPPAASDLVPELSLSYDSGQVDGQTASTQAQASWVGDGWSTPKSYIEQTFTSCKDKPEGTASPKATNDYCYNGPILTMSLNGSTSRLVRDATTGKWRPETDNGEVVVREMNTGNGSGTHDTDYWTVTTRSGTTYQFGRNQLPGWTAGKPTTKSVDTVPVYSPHAGGPCYSSAGFASSVCTMAWRWNLDLVTDARGNAMSYYYTPETNRYGRNEGATMDSYTRDSYLHHIDYGFRSNNAYTVAPNRIDFMVDGRCTSGSCTTLDSTTKAAWPDVPFDLICTSGTCDDWSPSFFSTKRLVSIQTKQWDTASSQYLLVDAYALANGGAMPATGDGTDPTLWLSSITRTGHDTTAADNLNSAITLPSVSFTSITLQNRVSNSGLPVFNRHRLKTITTETGSVISAEYGLPEACPATRPAVASNTKSCFPVNWTPAGYTEPFVDWFNKYAVTRVTATDPTGGAAATSTDYAYEGGAAWHFDDNEVVKAKYRTYGQFRGYSTVTTYTGNSSIDRRTKSSTKYYRGMSKNNNTTVVNVTDSAGGNHEDHNDLAGRTLETTSYKGEGGDVDNSSIQSYWISANTASRPRTGLSDLTANWVAQALVHNRQAITSGSTPTWRYTRIASSYDATISSPTVGLLKHSYSHTVPVNAAYDTCTTRMYAPINATNNLVGLVSQTETVAVACDGFTAGTPASVPGSLNTLAAPATVSRPAQVVSVARTFYDNSGGSTPWSAAFPQPAAPTRALVTMTQSAKDHTGGAYVFQTTARLKHNDYGRIEDAYDANGGRTRTTYTINAVGLTTGMASTNPLDHTSSTVIRPRRGLPVTMTDANNVATNQYFDALGRITRIWTNSRAVTAAANHKYTYNVSKTGVTSTLSESTNFNLAYRRSTLIYDAQLRVRQTQADTPNGGRLITDNYYDTLGRAKATFDGWWEQGTQPTTTLVTAPGLPGLVPHQTFTTYDGLGRPVIEEQSQNGLLVSKTTTVHHGDRTTVIPPDGGTVRTMVTDPLGRTSAVEEYTTRPTVTVPANTSTGTFTVAGGTKTTSQYGYDVRGNQSSTTDASGNAWTSQYDLLGRITNKTDPDAGNSTGMTYDPNGNLTQSTDARGKTTSATFDALNRKTAYYAATTSAQAPGNRLASWVYDNSDNAVPAMTYPKGQLTSATSYANSEAYKTQFNNFTVFGKSLGETITIPSGEGLLAGDYTFSRLYNANNGILFKETFPLRGGLPGETITRQYNGDNMLTSMIGTNSYLLGVQYDAYSRIGYTEIGAGAGKAAITNTWDAHTGELNRQLITRAPTTPAAVGQLDYKYDKVGNLTRQTTLRGDTGGPAETQCYTYDQLRRLTEAWTGTDNCATTPTAANRGMVGNTIGGGSPYWTSWAVDAIGNRTQQIQRNLTGGADLTTTYAYGTAKPHALTGTTSTAPNPATSFAYDAAGNMTTRNAGNGNQTLTWNDANQLTTIAGPAGNSTNVYGADGNVLLQKDPGSTTLYLPNGQQHTLNTTNQSVTGTRYYPLVSGASVIRTGSGTNYTFALGDHHSTPAFYLNNTAQNSTWRQFTPYGGPRGAGAAYPDNRGFLNKPLSSATGLTRLGARDYDPVAGKFIAVDPILDPADPQQWNGYVYSNNNPTSYSDPSGLKFCSDDACGPDASYVDPNSGKVVSPDRSPVGTSDDVIDIGNEPTNIEESTAQIIHGRGYRGSARYTYRDLLEFSSQSTDNWIYVCMNVFGGSDSRTCEDNSPIEPQLSTGEQFLFGGVILLGLGGAMGCVAFIAACASFAYGAIEGEAAFAGTGALVGGGGAFKAVRWIGKACSFSGDTMVLMADGSTKRIEDVQVGDEVFAVDPEKGEKGGRKVTHVWPHEDDLTDLQTSVGLLTTTEDHPFWNDTDRQWQRADSLDAGDQLLSTAKTDVTVKGLLPQTTYRGLAYNLTVDGIPTYHVLAGNTPVLVHNTPCKPLSAPNPVPRAIRNSYENIRASGGQQRFKPDGTPDIFTGTHGEPASVQRQWGGSTVWEVPASRNPGQTRILVNPKGQMGYTTDHYKTIQEFTAPHYPDWGW